LIDDRVIIDNIKVYEQNDNNKLIICPTYDFKLPENLPCIINEKLLKKLIKIFWDILNDM
jgi:hypothetical protein